MAPLARPSHQALCLTIVPSSETWEGCAPRPRPRRALGCLCEADGQAPARPFPPLPSSRRLREPGGALLRAARRRGGGGAGTLGVPLPPASPLLPLPGPPDPTAAPGSTHPRVRVRVRRWTEITVARPPPGAPPVLGLHCLGLTVSAVEVDGAPAPFQLLEPLPRDELPDAVVRALERDALAYLDAAELSHSAYLTAARREEEEAELVITLPSEPEPSDAAAAAAAAVAGGDGTAAAAVAGGTAADGDGDAQMADADGAAAAAPTTTTKGARSSGWPRRWRRSTRAWRSWRRSWSRWPGAMHAARARFGCRLSLIHI